MKKSLLLAWMILSIPLLVFSQSRQITGTVTDDKGNALPAVTVLEKGTNNGTVTNNDGLFSLAVKGANPVLVLSYTGMLTQEVRIGTESNYSVSLQSNGDMSEVVVTAFGIRKERRSLGYTVQTVGSADLNVNRQSNVVNALQGKVAGVTITS